MGGAWACGRYGEEAWVHMGDGMDARIMDAWVWVRYGTIGVEILGRGGAEGGGTKGEMDVRGTVVGVYLLKGLWYLKGEKEVDPVETRGHLLHDLV